MKKVRKYFIVLLLVFLLCGCTNVLKDKDAEK